MSGEHTIATALVKAQKAHKRKAADFYPTPPDVTVALVEFLALHWGSRIWEPACGDGAMARVLEAYHCHVTSTDLRDDPSIYGTGGANFLTADVAEGDGPDWIITNPPFNLAEAFIRKSLSITPNVAMLLSNQYWHAATRKRLFDDHPPAWVLPLLWRPAFLEKERGKSPMMNVMWVVWQEGQHDARYRLLTRPERLPDYSTKSTLDPELEDLL
ncbi:DNA methyltransferase family protein [Aquamicrobium zhengzhouense]|uniref:SAM-dependent DNA methyltransferase n=1 Tax=Aquamicrobium zhengzhouense TaxID=2781738 RepID=A0ABS0S9U6_9HYPH|nr:hypothetical protein [Aquamicrobium zhengzhouense]MBI1620037.1 SAM-dependent DNA methyltransferase [Aquamicrobium zhengzhouense]